MTVSADVYRPAAIKQLETVSNEVGVGFIPSKHLKSQLILLIVRLNKLKSSLLMF
jgi:signal recognition particle GTPase